MHRWTDSDVEAIVGLVVRGVSTTENVDNAQQKMIDELCEVLGAQAWLFEAGHFELGESASWQPMSEQESASLQNIASAVRPFCQSSSSLRWQQLLCEQPNHGHAALAGELIWRCDCDCQPELMHPIMACWWTDQLDQAHYLEFQRTWGEPEFTERDQAILRVVIRQFDLISVGKTPTKAAMFAELSKRQREVLELLLVGKNGKQIASELELSVYTVNDYIKAIYRRFDVSNRAELLAAARG